MSFLDPSPGDGEDSDFADFIAGVDALVVGGGHAALAALAEGHDLPHRGLPIWLVSHDEQLAARACGGRPRRHPGDSRRGRPRGDPRRIGAAGHERAWIGGGGDIAGQALAADRVDEVILTIAPTVLGAGAGVFDHADLPRRLFTLAECREYGKGSVRLRWVRDRPSAASPAADSMSLPIG